MFLKRFLSSVIIIAVFLALILFSYVPWVLNIGIALLSAAAVYEALMSTKFFEGRSLMVAGVVYALVMPFAAHFSLEIMLLATFVFAMVIFVIQIVFFKTFNFKHTCVVLTVSVVISFFFSTAVFLRAKEPYGLYLLFYLFTSAWMTDVGAYTVGSLMGRHKLCPLVSPKKTVEGAVGGVLFAVLGIFLCTLFFRLITGVQYNYFIVLPVALGAAVTAEIGDLIASIIKRTFEIKDFGNVIPGHGGIFDRFDSIIFVAPYVYFIFNWLSPV